MNDRKPIAHLESRLVRSAAGEAAEALADLEMLADLYMGADSHLPALETLDRLLSLPAARTLSRARRLALELKAVECRIARGDCLAALAQCRELLQDVLPEDPAATLARLHLLCAKSHLQLGHIEELRASSQSALDAAESAGDLSASAVALMHLGVAHYREGDLALARDVSEQALALFRRLGDVQSVARVRNNLGLIHKNLCEWGLALSHFESALAVYREHGLFAESARPLMNLGIVLQKRGDWAEAEKRYQECEQVLLHNGDETLLALVAIGMGNVARLQRRFPEAESFLRVALERARSSGAKRAEVLSLEFLGELDFDRGRPEVALSRYQDALALAARTAPEGDLVVEIERRRAEALCSIGRLDDAASACERARRLARVTDDRLEQAVTHRVAGEIAMARGKSQEALAQWGTADTLLRICDERYERSRLALLLGRSSHSAADARRHLYRACAGFADLGSAHWQTLAEADLKRLLDSDSAPALTRSETVIGRRHRAPSLVACSPGMRKVESLARRAAGTELSVLVLGETGTGKELVARTIHTLSSRADRPFLAVNCGALRAELALSQLFGHRRGAFTGAHAEGIGLVEAAHGGTLFLDEAGELPLDVQVTLLRFLETGEYMRLGETQVRRSDVRLIAATNRSLRGEEGEQRFRRDLLYRLNEIEIRLPSLRERSEDIVPLARHFLTFYGGLEGPRLTPDAEAMLAACPWPGNVRELENIMKRIAALHSGVLDAGAILPLLGGSVAPSASRNGDRARDERDAIVSAWREAGGNKTRLAQMLGISRKTLYERIRRHHLTL